MEINSENCQIDVEKERYVGLERKKERKKEREIKKRERERLRTSQLKKCHNSCIYCMYIKKMQLLYVYY